MADAQAVTQVSTQTAIIVAKAMVQAMAMQELRQALDKEEWQ